MSSIRDKAEQIINGIPDRDIRSNQGDDYFKYTGLAHQTMKDNWAKGGIMTGCNAFVGWYGRALGAPEYLGRFDLSTFLPSVGKGHAWVKSSGARRPKYGDILRHKSFHVDVCAGYDGDVLLRIAAGQGGKSAGCDILKRVRGKAAFSPANLEGWIDLELYFGEQARPAFDPVFGWVAGWWSVWDGNQYYYYFEPTGDVCYVKSPPRVKTAPPKLGLNQGSFKVGDGKLVINWNPADGGATQETFHGMRVGATQANGVSNRYSPLVATKM